MGSITHKALEMLARKKFAEQRGEATFRDGETGREYVAADVAPDLVLDHAFDHYSAANPHHNASPRSRWTEADRELCRKYLWDTLDFDGGAYDPRNRHVLAPEQYFDLAIDEPWAWYDVKDPHTGERVTGRYSIKGTMDLPTLWSPRVIELLDWKTGARKDWATGEEKTYAKLNNDPQMLLYYYALTRLYPDIPDIFATIFFVKAGGPFTLVFDRRRDVPRALEMLRRRFERIKNTYNPRRIINDPDHKWKCFSLCHFLKANAVVGGVDTGKKMCQFYHEEVQQLGLDRVVREHGRPGAWRSYGSGGGQSDRDGPPAATLTREGD